ncbi:MAG TPA: ferrous iron transport protein B [Desulfuromonadales bacterium]|nr:ferrous iron transport protein B [Desulfuromonadales bacterium]
MKKILLVGLPNVGKSTLFDRLITDKIRTGSYPGSSVGVRRGDLKIDGDDVEIIDIPGVCNLFFNEDNERVARNILIDEMPDLIIQVCDAKNLNRSLALTALLAELSIPVVIAVNMVDEAAQKGIKVKRHKLEEMLGAPVVETIASEGVGVPTLISALSRGQVPAYPSRLSATLVAAVNDLTGLIGTGACEAREKTVLAIFSLAGDHATSQWALQKSGLENDEAAGHIIKNTTQTFHRHLGLVFSRANDLWAEALYMESIYVTPVTSTPLLNRLGDMALTPVAGSVILVALIALLYFIVGKFAAGIVVDFLLNDFFGAMVAPHLKNVVAVIPYAFVRDIIVGEYGLYTMALVPVLGLLLPILTVFFFTFGFIEDSGYIPRLSILLDRTFRKIGLNGKAVLPMVLGFSCVTMATISTRVLDNKRERFIAIFLLSLGIPCSAKLSIILAILAQVSFAGFLVVFGVIFSLTVVTGFVLNKLMPVETSNFIMEIPPIRIPSLKNVLAKTSYRSLLFLQEAVPLFLISALGLFFADKIGLLTIIETLSAPIISGFLGLPPQFAESLIMGFIRGEAGVAVLKKMVDSGVMNHAQLVVAMVVTILFIPCVTNFMLIIKEQGAQKALAIIVSVTTCAIVTGGILNHFFRWANIVF